MIEGACVGILKAPMKDGVADVSKYEYEYEYDSNAPVVAADDAAEYEYEYREFSDGSRSNDCEE
jgi:hypothetical protein